MTAIPITARRAAVVPCCMGSSFELVPCVVSFALAAREAQAYRQAPRKCDGTMFDWNDLRHFLAVARTGSMNAAARSLGVDSSTVQRRVAALEKAIGRTLVERRPDGYALTAQGQ